jgi:hypothetical protein
MTALAVMPTHALSLYELTEEQLALDELSAMEDGEWTPELEQLATQLLEQLIAKADAFGGYVRELEARETVLEAEIKRLQDRKKRVANRLAWMKAYATTALQRMDRPRLEGTRFTLAIQKNPPSLLVTVLPDALPPEFIRVIPEQREADKKALLEAVKQGATIPGVELAPTTYHLRIR